MFRIARNTVRRTRYVVADVRKNIKTSSNLELTRSQTLAVVVISAPLCFASEVLQALTRTTDNLSRRISQI